jgi:fibronectin type 3 domain-containing protein
VRFDPAVGGTATGEVSIVSSATNSPSVLSLTGTGIHWVSLNWTASASPEIILYNVYEGTVSGGPYIRLGSLTGTTYEDGESGLAPGSTQYYVVTAVDDTGLESSHSNEASVLIPTP